MGNKPGNPRNGRRLHGVPKAGPLYVNGIETRRENPQRAVSRIYRSASRSLADTSQPGAITILRFGQILNPQLADTCAWCGNDAARHDTVALEADTGTWWHMDIRQPAGSCRFLSVRASRTYPE